MLPLNVPARSKPDRSTGGKPDRRSVGAGELIAAGGDAAETLQAAEQGLAVPVASPNTADLPLAGAGDHRRDACAVGRHPAGSRCSPGSRILDGVKDPWLVYGPNDLPVGEVIGRTWAAASLWKT